MLARSALIIGLLALGWSLAVLASGGIDLREIGVPLVARTPWPTTVAAAVLLLVALLKRRGALIADLSSSIDVVRRYATLCALVLTVASGLEAVRFGTKAVGGSDSNCYVEQAERWAAGTMLEPIRAGFTADWPNAALSLTPTGFVPSARIEGAIAPICPSGLSLAMALPRVLGAPRESVFAVVPICAAIAVFSVFLIGRRLVGPLGGLCAALLTMTSPVFLYQAVQPMSDVPAAALWVLALACAARGTSPAAFVAGLVAGAAVLVRPNLAPLAGLVVMASALGRIDRCASPACASQEMHSTSASIPWRRETLAAGWRQRLVLMLVGLLPGFAGVGVVQHVLYGSALSSGYGNPGLLFRLEHVTANVSRYPLWLIETQTVFILLGFVAPLVLWMCARFSRHEQRDPRSITWAALLWLFTVAAFVAYMPYVPFDGWWFVRFWLPGLPPLLVLSIAATQTLASLMLGTSAHGDNSNAGAGLASHTATHLPASLAVVGILCCTTLGAWQLGVARDRSAFRLQRFEHKFVTTGRYVSTLPSSAVVLTIWHSGAVWYYGKRPAIMWDAIAPDGLDAVITSLRRQERDVYLLLEPSEEDAFKRRFADTTALVQLDWPPRARFGNEATLWAVDDRDRFLRGETVQSERVWSRTGMQRDSKPYR